MNFRKIALWVTAFIMIASVIGFASVSAMQFDNSKQKGEKGLAGYDNIKIKNLFGLGATLWEGELTKNTNECGSSCSAEKTITIYNTGSLIDDVRFETITEADRYEQPIRSYQFYIKTGEEEIDVDDYEWVCTETGKVNVNGTKETKCENKKTGSHKVKKPLWESYSLGQVVPAGTYEVKLEGEKKPSRTVDWVIKSQGIWITDWAEWGSLSVGLVTYYGMDEGSGSVIYDSKSSNDGTLIGNPTRTSGKIGGALNFTLGKYVNITNSDPQMGLNGSTTWTAWVYANGCTPNYQSIMLQKSTTSPAFAGMTMGLYQDTCKLGTVATSAGGWIYSTNAIPTGEWVFVGITVNSTNAIFYINGGANGTGTKDTWNLTTSVIIGQTPTEYWNGTIDEIGIWNRTLSAGEINDLYNNGVGFNPSGITLNSPVNNYISTTPSVKFNCSATAVFATMVNMSLWTNASGTMTRVQTLAKTGIINTSIFTETIAEATPTLWTCSVCDSDNDCRFASENRTVSVDSIAPSVTINNPKLKENYGYIGQNVTLNWTVTDVNLGSCWFNYNGTNQSVTCSTNLSSFILEKNNYNLLFYANDSVGNLNTTNYNWNYNVFGNSQTYSLTTTPLSYETFKINVTYNTSYYTSAVGFLNYNGATYSTTSSPSGTNLILTTSLTIPSDNENINYPFFWIFNLTNSSGTTSFNSNLINQSVSPINFRLCNSTVNVSYINFTIYDSEFKTTKLNSTFKSSFSFGTNLSGIGYSFEDLSEGNSSFAFCISPSDVNYTITGNIEYESTSYAKNYYYLTGAFFSNITTNISLYLLNSSKSTLTVLKVTDYSKVAIPDVYIQIQAYDIGTDTYSTVSMARTDYQGQDVSYLNWYDTFYKFILTTDGTVLQITNSTKIIESPKTFLTQLAAVFPYDKFNNVVYSLTFNNATNNFVLTFTDPSGQITSNCLRVIRRSPTADTQICNTCETSSSATIYCNIAAYGNGTFIATYYGLGSIQAISTIEAFIGVGNTIYNLIGKADAMIYAIFFSGIVLAMFMITPVLAIIGVLLGMIGSIALGFLPSEFYLASAGLIITGGILIWVLRR